MPTKGIVKLPPFKLPDRYEFKGKRLEGGQAFVYVCEDKFLDRDVVIKVPKNLHESDTLRKELETLCKIKSRYIAEVYDLVEAKRSNLFGIVEEYVPGANLEELARNEPLETKRYLNILYQIASGLSDVHSHDRVHRDLTPRNLKFDSENVVKILDFGLACEAKTEGITTKARGTPGFLAPEFYAPIPVKFGKAADVYAFGATVWSLANKGNLHPALMEVPPQRSQKMPSFSECGLDLPQEIVTVLDSTLAAESRSRPEIAYLRDCLKRHLLYGRHRATFHHQQTTHVLSEPGKGLRLKTGDDSIVIKYDGLAFVIAGVSGDAFINNGRAEPGTALPDSCVITLGAFYLGANRTFIPVDTSHPEVVV